MGHAKKKSSFGSHLVADSSSHGLQGPELQRGTLIKLGMWNDTTQATFDFVPPQFSGGRAHNFFYNLEDYKRDTNIFSLLFHPPPPQKKIIPSVCTLMHC